MRTLLAGSLAAAALSFALVGAPALADGDPTVDQIYQAARSGHLDQAQTMMDQVLRDHPTSSKAHYVQAELYVREGNPGLARSELARAEQLDPGLTKEDPRAVQELKSELGLVRRSAGDRPLASGVAPAATYFPWKTLIILALVVGVFWMLVRRRTYAQYPGGVAPMGGPAGPGYGPGGYVGPGGGGYVGPGGGGIGSSVAGGLAGGLAAGAGIVAGEELAHHFLDGGQRPVAPPPGDDGSWNNQNANSDMGGKDFGVNDPGAWDDNSGGGGGDFGGDSGGGGDGWT